MTREERARERVAATLADYASSPHPLQDILFRLILAVERETAERAAERFDHCGEADIKHGEWASHEVAAEIREAFGLEEV